MSSTAVNTAFQGNNQRFNSKRIISGIALMIALAILGSNVDHFLSAGNLFNVLMQATPLGLMAIGLTAVLITGGIDLSIPAIMALAGIVGSIYMRDGGAPFAAACIMVAVATVGGCINGFAVAYLKMIPFVVTLSTQAIAMGACVVVTNSVSVLGLHQEFIGAVTSKIWGVPATIVALTIVTLIVYVLSKKSIYGRWLYAVGINSETARVSGIPKQRVIFGAYAFAGLFAGLAAIVITARLASASPTMGQEGVVLNVVGAAVVGGVSIYGGAGSFAGAVAGAVIITLISNVMNLAHLSYYATLVVKGVVIVAVVAMDARSKRA